MKCDDDTFVNIPNLIHVLLGGTIPVYKSTIPFYDKISVNAKSARNRLVENKYLLMGYKFCSAKPISDVTSKWYAPNYLYNGEFYPDYLSGTAYVMTLEAAKRLYKGSFETALFHLEDVYLTGFVADRIKMKRQHHPLFYYLSTKDQCSLRGMLTQHQMTPMTLEMAYAFVTNTSIPCNVPDKNFMSAKLKLTQRKRCQ
jgi:beta-1,3-galactosyltransferase 1